MVLTLFFLALHPLVAEVVVPEVEMLAAAALVVGQTQIKAVQSVLVIRHQLLHHKVITVDRAWVLQMNHLEAVAELVL
jgi:hypothetical protein